MLFSIEWGTVDGRNFASSQAERTIIPHGVVAPRTPNFNVAGAACILARGRLNGINFANSERGKSTTLRLGERGWTEMVTFRSDL